jgi:hypothetical protein
MSEAVEKKPRNDFQSAAVRLLGYSKLEISSKVVVVGGPKPWARSRYSRRGRARSVGAAAAISRYKWSAHRELNRPVLPLAAKVV